MNTHDMTLAADIIAGTIDLLRDPKNWTKLAFARNADYQSVLPYASSACSWCLVGGIERICHEDPRPALYVAVIEALEDIIITDPGAGDPESLQDWNDRDERTHAEVIEALETALLAFDG